jgi:hypothetical protein
MKAKIIDLSGCDEVVVEGIAAQLYTSHCGGAFCWWHVLREDIKKDYRKKAIEKIIKFTLENT